MKATSRSPKGAKLSIPEPIGFKKKDTYGCAAIAGTGCLIYVIIGIVAIVTFLIAVYKLLPLIIGIFSGQKIGG